MSILKRYQAGGEVVGFDPADISDETKSYSVETSNFDTSQTYEYGREASNYFEAVSKSLSGNINKEKPTSNIQVEGRVTKDIRSKGKTWYNYTGDEGYKPVKKQEKIKVGDTTVRITGEYGIRHLTGRDKQHSTGVDLTTSSGKAIALSGGKITSVDRQGSGEKTSTSGTPGAGYYITMQNTDGSKTQYMHLDPMTKDEMDKLVGKTYERGDELWGYKVGSGSMDGVHVKVRHFGDISAYNVDPSQLIRGIAYDFIPNSKGKNILNFKKGGLLRQF